MRTERLLLVFAGLIILSLMFTSISGAKIDPKTVAGYWKFDDGSGDVIRDSSGNGNDGKISGAKWADGKFGKALECSLGNFAEVPHSKSLDITKEITVTAWIKTSWQGLQCFVGKDDDSADNRSWHFCTQDGGLRFKITTVII